MKSLDQIVRIIQLRLNGTGIRRTAKDARADRATVTKYSLLVGEGCARISDRLLRNVRAGVFQLDELWTFSHTKQRHVMSGDAKRTFVTEVLRSPGDLHSYCKTFGISHKRGRRLIAQYHKRGASIFDDPPDSADWGDQWGFFALDQASRAIVWSVLDRRTLQTALMFSANLRARTLGMPTIFTDGWPVYDSAVRYAFGDDVNHGQLVKRYRGAFLSDGRQVGEVFVRCRRKVRSGSLDIKSINTSYVERIHGTLREDCSKFARASRKHAKSKRHLVADFALFVAHYNLVRLHMSIEKKTPGLVLGVTDHIWTLPELIEAALSEPEPPPLALPGWAFAPEPEQPGSPTLVEVDEQPAWNPSPPTSPAAGSAAVLSPEITRQETWVHRVPAVDRAGEAHADVGAIEDALQQYWSSLTSLATRRAYSTDWKRYAGWCRAADIDLRYARPRHIDQYVQHLVGLGNGKATVSRALSVLRQGYGALVRAEIVVANPAREVKGPKSDSAPRTSSLGEESLGRLFAALGGDSWIERRDRICVALVLGTAKRRSEVARIGVGDLRDGDLHGLVRGGKQECVRLPDWLQVEIAAWREFAGISSGPLLPRSADDSSAINGDIVYHIVRCVAARAGLPLEKDTPGALRRTVLASLGGTKVDREPDIARFWPHGPAPGGAAEAAGESHRPADEEVGETSGECLLADGEGSRR